MTHINLTSLMKKIVLLFATLVVFCQNNLFSQAKKNIDSLTAVLNKYPKEDTVKARMLIDLSGALMKVDYQAGMAYCEKALVIAENFNALLQKADALFVKGWHLES